MNATSIAQQVHLLGVQAKAASSLMAKASAAQKSLALRGLAKLLRSHTAALQMDNTKDIERAKAAGLEAAMVDRLKLTPQVLETCAQGCEQLANMPDIIGDIIGMKEQPSGIRVGQMRVPIGVFGMVFESRPNVTIEAASLAIKSGNACILRGGSEAIDSNKALALLVQQALQEHKALVVLPGSQVQLVLQVLQVSKVLLVPKGFRVSKGLQELRVQRVIPVHKGLWDQLVQQARKELRVRKAILV